MAKVRRCGRVLMTKRANQTLIPAFLSVEESSIVRLVGPPLAEYFCSLNLDLTGY